MCLGTVIFSFSVISVCFANTISPNYFCADMTPQYHVSIDQLMGMWYGIEIVNHNYGEEYYVRRIPSCPIIHISEDKSNIYPDYGPLHRDYNYGYNYGERRDYNPKSPYDRLIYSSTDRYNTLSPYDRSQYDRFSSSTERYNQFNRLSSTLQPDYNFNIRKYGTNFRNRYGDDIMKRLRIWWDENGSGTEYLLRYNISRPGFWVSSGPSNGSELEPQYSHFAGTVQVLKAVGDHLVLTFCHQLPDRQLFTVILSRENTLDRYEIHGVHAMLNKRGLSTNNIKKVCNAASSIALSTVFFLLVLVHYLVRK